MFRLILFKITTYVVPNFVHFINQICKLVNITKIHL